MLSPLWRWFVGHPWWDRYLGEGQWQQCCRHGASRAVMTGRIQTWTQAAVVRSGVKESPVVWGMLLYGATVGRPAAQSRTLARRIEESALAASACKHARACSCRESEQPLNIADLAGRPAAAKLPRFATHFVSVGKPAAAAMEQWCKASWAPQRMYLGARLVAITAEIVAGRCARAGWDNMTPAGVQHSALYVRDTAVRLATTMPQCSIRRSRLHSATLAGSAVHHCVHGEFTTGGRGAAARLPAAAHTVAGIDIIAAVLAGPAELIDAAIATVVLEGDALVAAWRAHTCTGGFIFNVVTAAIDAGHPGTLRAAVLILAAVAAKWVVPEPASMADIRVHARSAAQRSVERTRWAAAVTAKRATTITRLLQACCRRVVLQCGALSNVALFAVGLPQKGAARTAFRYALFRRMEAQWPAAGVERNPSLPKELWGLVEQFLGVTSAMAKLRTASGTCTHCWKHRVKSNCIACPACIANGVGQTAVPGMLDVCF